MDLTAHHCENVTANATDIRSLFKKLMDGFRGVVTATLFDNTVVRLQGVNRFLSVHAELEKSEEQQAIALRKGQTVTVQCRGASEVASAPMLDECTFQAPSIQVSEAK